MAIWKQGYQVQRDPMRPHVEETPMVVDSVYPRYKYHASEPPRVVKSEAEEQRLPAGWFNTPGQARASALAAAEDIERGAAEPSEAPAVFVPDTPVKKAAKTPAKKAPGKSSDAA